MSPTKRIRSLDGLRGIAAIAVMLFHFNIFFLPQAHLTRIVPTLIDRAYLAVDLFFLLSGFVMTHVHGQSLASDWQAHWRQFMIARFARVYPLFALTTLAMLMIVALSKTPLEMASFSYRSLALQPFLLQQWFSGLSWNYPSWSISTEAEAYLFFIFSARPLVMGRYPRLLAACCVAILAALSIRNAGSLNLFTGLPALLRTISEFSLGALLYRALQRDIRVLLPRQAAILAILFTALGIVTRMDFIIVGGLVCLIGYSVKAMDALGRLLNSRLSIALGDWSYSIYLWHAPTHCFVMATFAATGHSIVSLGSSSARLLVLATCLGIVGLSASTYKYLRSRLEAYCSTRAWPCDLS
jgi:peptidoglycan/LPS O-acetylase OafA/YrhL